MDEKTYKRWWQLHLRVAKEETLTPAEQIEYQAGLEILDKEEKEQLITAVRQLEPEERAKIARALADTELDTELTQLITELYSQPPVDGISDDDILAEIRGVAWSVKFGS